MRIAAEIPQHLHRAAERSFGANHPAPQMQSPEQLRKLFRIGKDGRWSAAAELAELTQPFQSRDELAAKDFSEHWDGQEEITPCRHQWLWSGFNRPPGPRSGTATRDSLLANEGEQVKRYTVRANTAASAQARTEPLASACSDKMP